MTLRAPDPPPVWLGWLMIALGLAAIIAPDVTRTLQHGTGPGLHRVVCDPPTSKVCRWVN